MIWGKVDATLHFRAASIKSMTKIKGSGPQSPPKIAFPFPLQP
jgi:hypothetical protein